MVLEHLLSLSMLLFSFETMEIREFKDLREKVQALIRSNDSLVEERNSFAEKLISHERQIKELRERCEWYERTRKEARQRVSSILNKIDRLKP